MKDRFLSPTFRGLLGPMAVVAAAGIAAKVLQAVAGVWVARRFGAGSQTDAYLLAKGLGMACYLVGDSLLYNALVPLWRNGRSEGRLFDGFLWAVLLAAVSGAGAAAAALWLRPTGVLVLIAPEASPATLATATPLCRAMGLAALLAAASSFLKAVNAGEGRYVFAGLDPLVLSGTAVAVLLLTPPSIGIGPLAWSIAVAFGVLLAVQWAAARRSMQWAAPRWRHPLLASTAALVAPLVALNLARQVNALVLLRFAAQTSEGAVSWLNYSYSVAQGPVGVVDLVLFSSVLPFSAALAAQHDTKSLHALFGRLVWLLLLVLAPLTAWVLYWRFSLVDLLFGSRAFTALDARMTAACLAAYAVAIVPWCIEALICRFLFALKRHWLYFLIVVGRVALHILLCLFWGPFWGAPGLAAAFAVSYAASATGGAILVGRQLHGASFGLAGTGLWLRAVGFAVGGILLTPLICHGLAHLPGMTQGPLPALIGSSAACLGIISGGVWSILWWAPVEAKAPRKEHTP